MLQFFINIFKSTAIKKAFKLFASLASVIFVVSGYVFFQKSRNEEELEEDSESPIVEIDAEPESGDEKEKKGGKVHFLFGNRKN